MKIDEVIKAISGNLEVGFYKPENYYINGVSTDSRNIKENELFIALVGEKFDGHDFIHEAQKKGAGGAIVNTKWWELNKEKHNITIPVIVVEDTLKALQDLAHYHRSKYKIPVIAITGSNGKTTTKDILASILSVKYKVVKNKGSFNNEIGLPLTLLEINDYTQAVVVEMGMRGLQQISHLCSIARPDMGIITNVGPVHLELLGTLENIARAKSELAESINEAGKVLLNGEDKWSEKIKQWANADVCLFGFTNECKYRAKHIKLLSDRSVFDLTIDGQHTEIILSIPGKHNILNSLAAAGAAYELGFDIETIKKGLKEINISEKRLNIIEKNNTYFIDDTYNANPISMSASIDILSKAEGIRKIAVLGDMYELGQFEKEGHYLVGRKIFHNKVDYLVTVGKLASLISNGAVEEGMEQNRVFTFNNNESAAIFLKKFIKKGDCLLFKGSRAAKMEEILNELL